MKEILEKAQDVLLKGGVILYPTDTIWGLGCGAENKDGILKLDSIKERGPEKNYLVLIDNERMLNNYVQDVPEVAYDLLDNSDQPMTIVYPKASKRLSHLAAKDGSIAIRVTKDKFCVQLIQKIKMGLISTSANISGTPYEEVVSQELRERVDYCVDLPLNQTNEPSKMIKLSMNGEFKILRG